MSQYSLTIVVPTHARPDLLPRAIDSALGQTTPCRVLIADDGDADRTAAILRERYGWACRSGQLIHLRTGATDCWGNWRAGMEAVETEFGAFHQDDDVVCRSYAARILYAFAKARELGADPHVWMARLDCADATGQFGLPYIGNGPWVPARSLHDECEPGHWAVGTPIAVSSYFTSWSLSPAIAYRTGPRLTAALRAMPDSADIFVERIIPAEMAIEGGFIADPARVGYWTQHGDNLSREQHPDQPRQTKLLVAHLDALLDRLPGWERPFRAWCTIVPTTLILGWLDQLDVTEREGGASRHGAAIRREMWASLEGRVKVWRDDRPRWRRVLDRVLGREAVPA